MPRILPLALLAAASLQAANTVTFNGVTLEGLTTITDASALGTFGAYQASGIATLTDASWQVDGVDSLKGGPLVGEFGATFASAGKSLYIISPGLIGGNGHSNHIGSFTVSLLLSNDQFVSAGTFNDLSYTVTSFLVTGTYYGSLAQPLVVPSAEAPEAYAQFIAIDLAQFDTQGLGVKGVKFDNFGSPWLDLNYVGITGTSAPVPEPSTYGLALGGLALVGAVIRRRRSK